MAVFVLNQNLNRSWNPEPVRAGRLYKSLSSSMALFNFGGKSI